MRILTLATDIGCFFLGAIVTFAIIRGIDKGNPELTFVVGAILATNVAAMVHHRQSGTANNLAIKLALGAMLAISAVVFGVLLHFAFSPFKYPEVSVPIAAVGCFVFPLVLFNTMWKAMSKSKDN
jgi:hypothetical protein